jgi:hypothetical protein
MRDTPLFIGMVTETEDGAKLLLDFPKQFRAYYRQFAGHEVVLTIEKKADAKTRQQEKGFHAMIAPWAKAEGHQIEDLKRYLLGEIFGYYEDESPLTGERLLREPSTSKLSKSQYSELIERTLEIAAWAGHVLEAPSEYRERTEKARKRAARTRAA